MPQTQGGSIPSTPTMNRYLGKLGLDETNGLFFVLELLPHSGTFIVRFVNGEKKGKEKAVSVSSMPRYIAQYEAWRRRQEYANDSRY